MVDYEAIYNGASYLLDPGYSFTAGYTANPENISIAIDPRTANQLGEINTKLNVGAQNVEVQGVDAKTFESIPQEHLKELNRMTKLVGVNPSLHGPLVEASGVGERGWDETNRQAAERQIESAVIRSHDLDPKGNIPVTFHTTAQLPEMKTRVKEGKEEKLKSFWVIDPSSGKFAAIEPRDRYFPETGKFEEKPQEFDPNAELKRINEEAWTEKLSAINRYANYGEDIIDDIYKEAETPEQQKQISEDLARLKNADLNKLDEPEKTLLKKYERATNHGQIYLRDSYVNMKQLFDQAYQTVSDEDKKKLKEFAEWAAPIVGQDIENDPAKLKEFSEVIEKGLQTLGRLNKTPEIYKPLNDFVIEKDAETFANVAATSFKKFGENSPIISLENPPAGSGLSRGEDIKKTVELTRKKFTENLVSQGKSKKEAEKIADTLIGVTWDVGHINMIRKFGYDDKDIVKETKEIAPMVKHVHLSDNFGFQHAELPMGMGNVPLKQVMKEIDSKVPSKDIKKVIEAGDWFQHFADRGGGHPFAQSMQNMASPFYQGGPTWNQLGTPGAYYSGHGMINTGIHHQTFGLGFTPLPVELGGEMPGAAGGGERGRMMQGGV